MEAPRRLGRYRLLRRIARGGMGEVHLAELQAPGGVHRLVAIKLLIEPNAEAQSALLSEARLAALISHPNVVQLLDAGVDDGIAWFAMEFVSGPSLAELFDAASGNIPPWVAARLAADTCAALHAVHEATDQAGAALQIVHRDVTPHNILVSSSGFIKLADFGIARSALHHLLTKTGVVKGKLGYLSPEQAGGGSVDRRSDMFSLGILLWELLAGARLFKQATEGETMAAILRAEVPRLRDRAPHVPPALERIAERAMQKDPGARFANALEMQRALENALQSSGAHVGAAEVAQVLASVPAGDAQKALEWARKNPSEQEPAAELTRSGTDSVTAGGTVHPARTTPRRAAALGATLLVTAVVIALAIALAPKTESARPEPPNEPEPVVTSATVARLDERATPQPAPPQTAEVEKEAAPLPSPSRAPAPVPARTPRQSAPSARPAASAAASATATNGTLNVTARPKWALISVDGKSVGSTPVAVSGLSVGTHSVEAALLGEAPVLKKTVEVEPGKIVRVHFVFPE